jgi:ferritin-like metal-binding protein YciE
LTHSKRLFQDHLEETKNHVKRLEEIFRQLETSHRGKKCKAMEGLLEEGKETLDEDAEPHVKDAALISAAQRVEHYEIAVYGTAQAFAKVLGNERVAELLHETLGEEKAANEKLSNLAETAINMEAVGAGRAM